MRFLALLLTLASLAVATPAHAQGVTVRFTTTPAGGNYAPRNVVVVWIEDGTGTFVKTIGRWANQRKQYLLDWVAKAGANDADAVTSATRMDHLTTIQAVWNLQNKQGVVVPDGTYTIRMELADADTSTAANNHEGTFTFVKGPNPQVQTALSNGGFNNVNISYAAQAACGNGVIDPGETCDPVASCPASCASSGDACMPNVLVGAASSCTAQCQMQLVTACHDNDGCCPPGCTGTTDSDCPGGSNANPATGSGGTDGVVEGGCATSSSSTGPASSLVAFVIAGLIFARHRRTSDRAA
jgi:hypothetical protein